MINYLQQGHFQGCVSETKVYLTFFVSSLTAFIVALFFAIHLSFLKPCSERDKMMLSYFNIMSYVRGDGHVQMLR